MRRFFVAPGTRAAAGGLIAALSGGTTTMSRLVPWSLCALATALSCAPAAAQTRRFDGTWSVEVVTEQGSCDRAYRYSVIVENGRARYGGRENFQVNGRVQPNGAVNASISRGQDRAEVRGRLSDGTGRGNWATRGSRTCSGYWNAERRG
jgi:hypothetical protein